MCEPLFLHSIVVQSKEQISRNLDEECVVLGLENSVYYGLDPVGTYVWNLLREPCSVDALRNALLETYDVEAGRCERNLIDLLDEMRGQGLAEVRTTMCCPGTLGVGAPAKQEQITLSRKPYSPPKLTIYGTVAEMTRMVGTRGQADNSRDPRKFATHA